MREQTFFSAGVGSKQAGGKHALFLDLDDHSKDDAQKVAKEIIHDYASSDCYIVESSKGNHHLVNFDLFSFSTVSKIAEDYAHEKWLEHRKRGGDFVLRTTPKVEIIDGKIVGNKEKPRLVSIVKSPFMYREKSNSLRMIFSEVWGIEVPKDRMFNESKLWKLHVYRIKLGDDKDGKTEKKH